MRPDKSNIHVFRITIGVPTMERDRETRELEYFLPTEIREIEENESRWSSMERSRFILDQDERTESKLQNLDALVLHQGSYYYDSFHIDMSGTGRTLRDLTKKEYLDIFRERKYNLAIIDTKDPNQNSENDVEKFGKILKELYQNEPIKAAKTYRLIDKNINGLISKYFTEEEIRDIESIYTVLGMGLI
jgi:hypothetical protein